MSAIPPGDHATPPGYHTVTPYLVVASIPDVLAFLAAAFEAVETEHVRADDGTSMHAEVRIGDSLVMLGQARDASSPSPAILYVYDADVDARFARALQAGGDAFQEPTDQFYGDRTACVVDPAGNQWWIATRKETLDSEELGRRAADARGK